MTHSLFRSTVLAAVAVAAAGFGCTNLDTSGVSGDPSVTAGSTAAVPRALATVAPVIEIGVDRDHRNAYVVLDTEPDDAVAVGAANVWRDPIDPTTMLARRPLAKEALAALVGIEGTHVRLTSSETGAICEGVLGAPFAFGRVSTMDEGEPKDATLHADDAEGSEWARTGGARSVVAEVSGNDCLQRKEAPTWTVASLASDPALQDVGMKSIDDESTRAALLGRFRALPEWTEIASRRRTFDADEGSPAVASWDEADGISPSLMLTTIGDARYAWVTISTGSGCGGFDGELSVLFESHGGDWTTRTIETMSFFPEKAWQTARGVAWTSGPTIARPEKSGIALVTPGFGFEGCGC